MPTTQSAITVSLHMRDDRNGWQRVRTAPANSPQWDAFDHNWIDTLLTIGDDTVIVGNVMYQIHHRR